MANRWLFIMPLWLWLLLALLFVGLLWTLLVWLFYLAIVIGAFNLIVWAWWKRAQPVMEASWRAEWRDLMGIADTPENDWIHEDCFGRGCSACGGSGCRDGIPRNLTL